MSNPTLRFFGRIAAIICCFIAIHGCARVKTTPPEPKEIQKSKVYELNFDKAWDKAVDWFAGHNIQIDRIEKSSGFLTAKYLLRTNSAYLDCGTIDASNTSRRPDFRRYGTLNVTVRAVDATSTRVNVNFFGEYQFQARGKWDGRITTYDGHCVSTGQIEEDIFKFIIR